MRCRPGTFPIRQHSTCFLSIQTGYTRGCANAHNALSKKHGCVALSTCAAQPYWHYLLQAAEYPVRLIEDTGTHTAAGYICTLPNQRGIKVIESGIAEYTAGMAALQQLRRETSGEIQIGWPQTDLLVQLGRSLGSTPVPGDQWLLRVRDVAHFLTKIGRVFGASVGRIFLC